MNSHINRGSTIHVQEIAKKFVNLGVEILFRCPPQVPATSTKILLDNRSVIIIFLHVFEVVHLHRQLHLILIHLHHLLSIPTIPVFNFPQSAIKIHTLNMIHVYLVLKTLKFTVKSITSIVWFQTFWQSLINLFIGAKSIALKPINCSKINQKEPSCCATVSRMIFCLRWAFAKVKGHCMLGSNKRIIFSVLLVTIRGFISQILSVGWLSFTNILITQCFSSLHWREVWTAIFHSPCNTYVELLFAPISNTIPSTDCIFPGNFALI